MKRGNGGSASENPTCKACRDPDDSCLVQCDHCKSFWHCHCAGVKVNVSDGECTFTCVLCMEPAPNLSRKLLEDNVKSATSVTGISSTSSAATQRARLGLEKLAAEKAFAEKMLEQERREQERRHELEKAQKKSEIERKKLQLEKQLLDATFRQRAEEIDENTSRRSSSQQSSFRKVEQWQLKQCNDFSHRQTDQIPIGTRIDCLTKKQNVSTTHNQGYRVVADNADTVDQIFDGNLPGHYASSSFAHEARREIPNVENVERVRMPGNVPRPSQQEMQTTYDNGIGPSAQQIAARHVMAKDLPYFSGRPEEWPLFYSAYINSTQACGYSNVENLSRLQRCLKGQALESVRSRLLLPECIPHVITTLQFLYGRPEIIIHTLLQKIRNLASPKPDKLDMLITFGMSVQNFCDHLKASGQEEHLNNPTLLFELVEKLPANLKLEWSLHKQRCKVVNMSTFADYMSTLVRAAADVTLPVEIKQYQYSAKNDKAKERSFFGTHHMKKAQTQIETNDNSVRSCFVCSNTSHRVKDCLTFAKMEQQERWKTVQQHKLCWNCLGAHGRRPCKIQHRCGQDGCQARHHPLLHKDNREIGTNISKEVTYHHYSGRTVFFRIIPVTLYANNRSVKTFAFLDDGSSKTLIEESIVQDLGVEGEAQPLCLQWTAGVTRAEEDSKRVELGISGSNQHKYTIRDVRTVSNLDLPQQSIQYSELCNSFPHLKKLPIADYIKAVPRILIGSDNAYLTATLKLREGAPEDPVAVKTRLGWIIYGSNQISDTHHVHSFHICECEHDLKLNDMVAEYFSVENLGVSLAACPESEEIQRANQILRETTNRVENRFETGLLWKFDEFEFPDSYFMAVRRLQCLERRMNKDSVIEESVRRQLAEYEIKGYIRKATKQELQEANPRRIWYLPLGVSINPKKPSKIRIFCDAAATVDGVSLNTMLMKGPDLLTSLLSVIFGFREYRIAFAADIMEMFHQIFIRKEDRHSQRLLLRTNPTEEPQVYLMNVATFGSACSPCSAQYVKNLNAMEHANEYPEAAQAIIHKHYVDDYLDSVDSLDDAVRRALDVKYVHSRGGFLLRGWLSNSRVFLSRIGEPCSNMEKNLLSRKNDVTERVLGMYWRPDEDVFTYTTYFDLRKEHSTKRQVLRTVMKLFDPLGLLSFFVIHGKVLIQDIWRSKTEWDEPISEELCRRYSRWLGVLKQIESVRIPRCYFPHPVKEIKNLQLHIFCDASENAYACAAYLRAEINNKIQCALVAGKSKVAPLKTVSIPRLELMAAVIGARLRKTIIESHSLIITQTIFWCDSKTVLAWIHTSDPRKYRQFVSCRIGEILTLSNPREWNWVSTKDNVADEGTKWSSSIDLSQKSRWFTGPSFLYVLGQNWTTTVSEDTEEELRHCLIHRTKEISEEVEWTRFSNWNRLWRSIAFVRRYVAILRARVAHSEVPNGSFTQEEIAAAEVCIWRYVQQESYSTERLLHQKTA